MTDLVTTDWHGVDAAPFRGIIHRLDARIRVLLSVAFALVTVALNSLVVLALALTMAAILAALARLPAGPTLRRMVGMDAFMVPILLFLPFTVPGPAIAEIGTLTISAEGVYRAIEIVLKANAVVLALLTLVGTIEPATLGHALSGLGVPDKLTRMLMLTVRYIAVLHTEYGRLRLAMRARAFQPAGNLHTWRTLGFLFGMLLIRSFERSERMLEAMKCRGFAGRYFVVDAKPPSLADWIFAGVVAMALLVLGASGVAGRMAG